MQNIIFVLGMHRSGTSAMAGVLNKLGCTSGLPEELLPPDPNNALGYFERQDFVECNESILCENFLNSFPELTALDYFEDIDLLDGFGWLFGSWAPHIKKISERTELKIKRIIKNFHTFQQPNIPAITIKDPRASLTFPVWKSIFKNQMSVIIMVRNPLDVSESLYKRDKILPQVSLDMWLTYTKAAFENTKDLPVILIDYSDLINNKNGIIQKVVSFLKNNDIRLESDNLNSAKEHIKMELRHEKNMDLSFTDHIAFDTYNNLKKENINYLEKVKWPFEIDKRGWERALSHPVYVQKEKIKVMYYERLKRLLAHPITGPVIKTVRKLKKDSSFGDWK